MALAIDGSTPAIATQATGSVATVTTASFTPPAGAVLLVMYSANTIDPNDPGNPSITDSLGAHLTYTTLDIGKRPDSPLAEGQVATWTAVVGSSAAMTITVTNGAASPNRHAALCVQVLTGADTTTPVGAHGKASSIVSASSIAQNYTASATSGWGFLVVCDWFDAGAETAGTGCTLVGSADLAGQYTYAFIRRTTADDSNGVTNTLRATLPGGSTSLRWAWVEILPAVVAGGGRGTVLAAPAGQRLRGAGTAITLDHGTVIQAPAADVPNVVVQPSHGLPRRALGTTLVLTPRAEPSPSQNQPAEVPVISAGRPPAIPGQAWVSQPRTDPANTPPIELPVHSAGCPRPAPGSTAALTPRAEPSPAQNQPIPAPVIAGQLYRQQLGSGQAFGPRTDPVVAVQDAPCPQPIVAGRPGPGGLGAAQVLAPRADPAVAQDPPSPPALITPVRAPTPPGAAWTVTPRADPVVATDQPAPAPIVSAGRARVIPGASWTTRTAAEVVDRPVPLLVGAGAATAVPAPSALITRSTFTTPPVAFIHPPILVPGVRLPRLGSAWLQRPTEFTDHFCPPPTIRPDTGVTGRPDSGLTAWDGSATIRPDTGITARLDTGITTEC